jgi:hypothetical protein
MRVIAGVGEFFVQAAEPMPAAVRQTALGVRVVDHQQVAAGRLVVLATRVPVSCRVVPIRSETAISRRCLNISSPSSV